MSNIHSLDLAVGIPSYNEADNIAFVVRQVAVGLEKCTSSARMGHLGFQAKRQWEPMLIGLV